MNVWAKKVWKELKKDIEKRLQINIALSDQYLVEIQQENAGHLKVRCTCHANYYVPALNYSKRVRTVRYALLVATHSGGRQGAEYVRPRGDRPAPRGQTCAN